MEDKLEKIANLFLHLLNTFAEFKRLCDYIIISGVYFVDPLDAYPSSWRSPLYSYTKDELCNLYDQENVENIIVNHLLISIYSIEDGLIETVYDPQFWDSEKLGRFLTIAYDRTFLDAKSEFERNGHKGRRFSELRFKYDYLLLPKFNKLGEEDFIAKKEYKTFNHYRKKRNDLVHKKLIGNPNIPIITKDELKEAIEAADKVSMNILRVLAHYSE